MRPTSWSWLPGLVEGGRRGDVGRHPLDSLPTCWPESEGGLGTVYIYQASSAEKIREHATRADLPVDEIIEVDDTVIVRPDPAPATA